MENLLTWDEIAARYPNEWVALVEYEWPEEGELVAGIVFAHSPIHSELIDRAKGLQQAAIRWTGKKRGGELRAALHVDR